MTRTLGSVPRLVVVLLASWVACTGLAQAQPSANVERAATGDLAAAVTPDVRARLERLSPSNPELYFESAKSSWTLPTTRAAFSWARQLYVLAYHLDRARGGHQLASQACLAIAQLNDNEKDRRWLLSLAVLLDRRQVRPEWIRRADESASSQTSYLAATVLGLVRAGEGYAARTRLAEPGVAALLTSYERLLSATGDTGAVRWIEREAGRWPCPECHNQRIVKKGGGKDSIVKLCTTCGGNPGPKLNNAALVAQLRFESRLLNGIQRSWAAQAWSDQGAPLRDPDPEELPKQFDVDPERTLWRDGRWVAPADPAPPKPAPGAPNLTPQEPSAIPKPEGGGKTAASSN